MKVKTFFFITCYIAAMRISSCQGNRILYPDEMPDMFDALDLSKITTRLGFPSGDEGVCFNDYGDEGSCVFVRECPELTNYIRRNGGIRTIGDINFFRSRICRYLVNTVQLCCFSQTQPVISQPDPLTIVPNNSNSILPATSECGVTKAGRITSGEEYTHGVHPWLVGIGHQQPNGNFRVRCGGTLVTKKHVISAAHCFVRQAGNRELSHVILGEHSLSSNTERQTPIILRIAGRVEPGYNAVSHINDIAILTLEKEVTFTDYITPACIPFDLTGQDFEKETFTIVGWGDTFYRSGSGNDVPLMAQIKGVSKAECREAYKTEPQVPLDNTQFCANGGAKDTCQGDSGGPLLYKETKQHHRYFLLGIVSFGAQCGNPAFPGVYTFIPEFLNFIRDNLKP